MNPSASDDLVFIEDEPIPEKCQAEDSRWRILVVDDDPDVHEATEFALASIRILGRRLEILHAHSGREAIKLLTHEDDVALILLDVVMESENAGLQTVDAIRNELLLVNTRIILRTGQPGHAPEAETITRYDINDYKTKSELTHSKLFTTLTTAIRSYQQLQRLDASRSGLEKIVAASNQFMAEQGLQAFAEGVITQIAGLIGVSPEGLVCAAAESAESGPRLQEYRIIAAAGPYRHLIQRRLSEINDSHLVHNLSQALRNRHSIIGEHDVTLYFRKSPGEGFAAFINASQPICEVDQHLLEVFCTNIALCAKNVDLVSALRQDAFFDRQIGLPNRVALIAELDERIARQAQDDTILALIDIDQFSTTNDILGHQYGDGLLKLVAKRLRTLFDPTVYLARLSADTFALLGKQGQIGSAQIQKCFTLPFIVEEVEHAISISIGLVVVDQAYQSGAEILKDGYLALRRAKRQGMGQSITFSRDIGAEARERAQLLRDLRSAFDNRELFLAYQPQVDLLSGRLLGVEALLRWRLPDGSFVPPDRFIPIAEQSGLIVSLGNWLLHVALHTLKRFQAAGFPDLKMAVNISPVQIRQPGFQESILQALQETGCSPSCLELEVTESVALAGLDAAIATLTALRQQGIGIAIDDFGTGYSSLSYLDQLPANHLKIDRSFVSALSKEGHGARIARTIIILGHELGMRVIAEGVEDEGVASTLLELGCNEAQGYYYGRPMPEAEFIAWLAEPTRKRA